MTSLKEYIYNNQPEYQYRVKTTIELVPELMDKIERHLSKYDVKQVSKPNKLMLQSHNPDFPNDRGVEIYYIDVTLGLPAVERALANELAECMGAMESAVVIRGANNPIERDQQDMEDRAGKVYKVKMGTEYGKDEAPKPEPLFGDEYNSNFIKSLSKAQKERANKFGFAAKGMPAGQSGKTEPLKGTKSLSPISGAEQEKYK
jgi:hypothetical protein